jgi:hypothetical protein
LLGSLELLPVPVKIELGDLLLDLLPRRKMEPVRRALLWAMGRIGARTPVYGPLNTVVPADMAVRWLKRLTDWGDAGRIGQLAVMQMSRRTEDRYRDLPEKQRAKVLKWLGTQEAPVHFIELVRDGGQLDTEEQGLVFGEALPKGLRIL